MAGRHFLPSLHREGIEEKERFKCHHKELQGTQKGMAHAAEWILVT